MPNAANTVTGNGEILQPVCAKRCKAPPNTRTHAALQHLLTTVTSSDNHSVPLCRSAVRGESALTLRERAGQATTCVHRSHRYTCPLYSVQGSFPSQCIHQHKTTRRHKPPDHNMNSHRHQSPISRDTNSYNSNNTTLHCVSLCKCQGPSDKKVYSPMMTY